VRRRRITVWRSIGSGCIMTFAQAAVVRRVAPSLGATDAGTHGCSADLLHMLDSPIACRSIRDEGG
jgi:hypothetical protein